MTALGAASPAPISHPFPLTPVLPHLCPRAACHRDAGGGPDSSVQMVEPRVAETLRNLGCEGRLFRGLPAPGAWGSTQEKIKSIKYARS